MEYNFNKITPRRNTNSVKWDEAPEENIIPLWVADMDFPTYPAITEALHQRIDHGIFGYTHVPESYYQSVINWFDRRHHWQGIQRDDFIYTSGVVPAISAIIRALTLPGDKVLVQTPVYNCFFSSIRNQGCLIEECPLVLTPADDAATPSYTIDWEAFEQQCADSRVRIFLLCNPHNPAGRVWSRSELTRMGEICLRHQVFVISDEIHCEFTMPGYQYTPFASIRKEFTDNCAVCVAPTKAFNIAGLQIANIIVRNPEKRERIDRAINLHEVCDVNPFGVIATQAAYTEGGAEWLDQLNSYLFDNYQFLLDYFHRQLPQVSVTKLEGTYLVWADFSAFGKSSSALTDLLYRHGVWLNDGEMYGERSRAFLRINIACPREILAEGLQRIFNGLEIKD